MMIEKHMRSQLSQKCHAATYTRLLENVSSFSRCWSSSRLCPPSHALQALGVRRGGTWPCLVPVQVHAVSTKSSELARISFAGFRVFLDLKEIALPVRLPLTRCQVIVRVTVWSLHRNLVWVGCKGMAPAGGRPVHSVQPERQSFSPRMDEA